MLKYIYIIKTISLTRKTNKMLQLEFEISKIKHPKTWKSKTLNDYIEFLESWNWDKFSVSTENFAYCSEYSGAENKVLTNSCDMHDATYNYAAIVKVPCDLGYAETEIEDLRLFKFENDGYVPLNNCEEKEYLYEYFNFSKNQ